MSIEAQIEAKWNRILDSPLWMGVSITVFATVPLLLIPGIPLWITLFLFTVMLPPAVGGMYLLYYLYERFTGSDTSEASATGADSEPTAIEQLRQQYATGNISEETFERKLQRLLETEEIEPRQRGEIDGGNQETDLLAE